MTYCSGQVERCDNKRRPRALSLMTPSRSLHKEALAASTEDRVKRPAQCHTSIAPFQSVAPSEKFVCGTYLRRIHFVKR